VLVTEAHRDDALADVLAAYRASFAEVVRMLEELPDERLDDDGVYTFIANNTGYHYREHRQWIEAALAGGSTQG
jgi:predicted metal-dependent hydrolase